MRGHHLKVAQINHTLINKEVAREVLHHKTTMLHSREVTDISSDATLVEREVIDQRSDMFDMHIRVIDAIARVAMLTLLDDEVYILHKDILNLEREISLLLFIFLYEFIYYLLDVHHAIGCFADIEVAIDDSSVTQRNAVRAIEAREKNFNVAYV